MMLCATLTIVGLYVAFVLQTTVLPRLGFGNWTPQVVVWAVLVATGVLGPRAGIATAALCGLVADCLSSATLGPGIIGFGLAAYAAQHARRVLASQSPLVWACAIGLLVWLSVCTSNFARQAIFREKILWSQELSTAVAAALSTATFALVANLVAAPFRRTSQSFGGDELPVANRWRMLSE